MKTFQRRANDGLKQRQGSQPQPVSLPRWYRHLPVLMLLACMGLGAMTWQELSLRQAAAQELLQLRSREHSELTARMWQQHIDDTGARAQMWALRLAQPSAPGTRELLEGAANASLPTPPGLQVALLDATGTVQSVHPKGRPLLVEEAQLRRAVSGSDLEAGQGLFWGNSSSVTEKAHVNLLLRQSRPASSGYLVFLAIEDELEAFIRHVDPERRASFELRDVQGLRVFSAEAVPPAGSEALDVSTTQRPARFDVLTSVSVHPAALREAAVLRGSLSPRVAGLLVAWTALLALATIVSIQMWRAQDTLRKLVLQDSLTGLPNRLHFHMLLAQALDAKTDTTRLLGLFFIDLDNFKDTNDLLGHEAGDALLKTVALRLRGAVRAQDKVCRLSGDEFTVVLPDVETVEVTEGVARRILESLEDPVLLDGKSVLVNASIGIALWPQDGLAPRQLLRSADLAVYAAKRTGKASHVRFEPSLRENADKRLAMNAELKAALLAEQFVARYVPRVDLAGGRRTGFEAVLYWRHPTRGEIVFSGSAADAHEVGLSQELDRLLLSQVVRQLGRWNAEGSTQHVAVSLSRVTVEHPQFRNWLRELLQDHSVRAASLELMVPYIDEHQVPDVAPWLACLALLKQDGFRLVLDDFDPGLSSLHNLVQQGVDMVRLRRKRLEAGLQSAPAETLLRAAIALARQLKIRVVAADLETATQMHRLRRLGINEGSGPCFSAALEASAALSSDSWYGIPGAVDETPS